MKKSHSSMSQDLHHLEHQNNLYLGITDKAAV
jgi:hypothetical protein